MHLAQEQHVPVDLRQRFDGPAQRIAQLFACESFGGNFTPVRKILRAVLLLFVWQILIQ